MDDERVLLGRYRLGAQLGRGGMATVYRATDEQLGREVAIKLFPAGSATDDARRRAEGTALARLSHPHLVTLFDAHLPRSADEPAFLVMELVRGEDLARRLERGPLPASQVAELLPDLAEALAVVHAAGLVHRDVKPANVLLADPVVPGGAPVAKLADFGIAHLIGAERLTATGAVMGTAAYLSPELATGQEPGAPADVYALGLVALEALTGVREYPGTPVEAVTARSQRDPGIPASLPKPWRRLLAGMTARDPQQRPTAAEVAREARAVAPQLAAWTPAVADSAAVTVPLEAEPTKLLPAQAATARTRVLDAPAEADPQRRSRRLVLVLVSAAAAALALIAIALGISSASAPTAPSTTTAPPSPTPSATPSVVTPAPAPSPTEEKPGKGKGKGKGKEKDDGPGTGKKDE